MSYLEALKECVDLLAAVKEHPLLSSLISPAMSKSARGAAEKVLGEAFTNKHARDLALIERAGGTENFSAALMVVALYSGWISKLVPVFERYGPEAAAIAAAITGLVQEPKRIRHFFKLEKRYRPYLQRIAERMNANSQNGPPILQPETLAFLFRRPEAAAGLIEAYGKGAAGLIRRHLDPEREAARHKGFYDRLYAINPKQAYGNFFTVRDPRIPHALFAERQDFFLAIARHTGDSAAATFRQLPITALQARPQTLLQIARDFRELTPSVLRALGNRVCRLSADERGKLDTLRRLVEPSRLDRQALSIFPVGKPEELFAAIPTIEGLFERYGKAAHGVLNSFRRSALNLNESAREELDKIAGALRAADCTGDIEGVFGLIRPSVFRKHPGFYGELAEKAADDALPMVAEIWDNPAAAAAVPAFIIEAADHLGHDAAPLVQGMEPTLVMAHPELTAFAMRHCGEDCFAIFKYLSPRRDEALIRKHAAKYGQAFPALIERFEGEYKRREELLRPAIENIIALTKAGAPEFFRTLPVELWSNHRILETAAFYKEAAAAEFSARKEFFYAGESAGLKALRSRCQEEFGLHHFHRLCRVAPDGSYDVRLLERNLINLEIAVQSELPLFVHLLPRFDHNGAFAAAATVTEGVKEHYLILYLESGGMFDACRLLRKAACLRGTDSVGNPTRPIDHLTISHHANKFTMAANVRDPGEPYYREPSDRLRHSHFSFFDEAVLEEVAGYVAWGGSVVLDGCSTARGGLEQTHFAGAFKHYLPHATVWAVRDKMKGVRSYGLNGRGRICLPGFPVTADRVVQL